MKKQSLLLFLPLFATALSAQQSNLTGIVTYHNSKFETGKTIPVQNATVEEAYEGKFSTLTKGNGTFKMVLVGVEDGKSVSLHATKNDEDLEVVNTDHLQAVAGQKGQVKIYMASRKKLAEARREYYRIGKTEAEKVLNARYKKAQEELFALQEKVEGNETRIAELQKELTTLMADSKKIEDYAKDLAERYTKVNLDDASVLYLEAFRQFQAGKLKEALAILQRADLAGQAEKIWEEERKISNLRKEASRREMVKDSVKKDVMQALRLKADLHKAEFQWDSVEATYELLVRLDSNNLENLKIVARFFQQQNFAVKAISLNEKCLVLAKTEQEEVDICGNLGLLYFEVQKNAESEKMLLRGIEICERLYTFDTALYGYRLALALRNFAYYYRNIQKTKEAENSVVRALDIYEHLAKYDTVRAEAEQTGALSILAVIYHISKRTSEAEKMYRRAFEIRERLAKGDPSRYEPGLAWVANNLGILYRNTQRMPEAETMFLYALGIRERLAKSNPAQFEIDLATTENSLAIYYSELEKESEAEKMYLRSLEIKKKYAKINPKQYEPEVALTAMNLGVFYKKNKIFSKAEEMYLLALDIYEQSDRARYGLDLAMTTMNMGNLYSDIQKIEEAEKMYLRSFEIYKQLAENNPEHFEFESGLAMTAMNLGIFYKDMQRMVEAEKMYLYSIEKYQQLVKSNPDLYESEYAKTLNSFGEYWQQNIKFDKAREYFSLALAFRQKALLQSQNHQKDGFNTVYNNLAALRDSFILRKECPAAASVQRERATSLDSLRLIDSTFLLRVPLEYDTLARCYLLARDFSAAEAAARRGLALGPAQVQINYQLATALLLQGKEKEAKTLYQSLPKTNDKEQSQLPRDQCLQDLEALRAAGVASPRDVRRAKGWMK